MRTFFSDTTKIDVIAQISGDDLEVDRLVLRRFEGSETTATAAFQKLSPVTVAGRWRSMQWLPRRSLSADLLSGSVSGTPISGSRFSGNPLYRFDLRPTASGRRPPDCLLERGPGLTVAAKTSRVQAPPG